MFTRSTFDFPPGVAAAVVLFVIVILQITYRFSAMMVVIRGYVRLTSAPKTVQREAKQVASTMSADEYTFAKEL